MKLDERIVETLDWQSIPDGLVHGALEVTFGCSPINTLWFKEKYIFKDAKVLRLCVDAVDDSKYGSIDGLIIALCEHVASYVGGKMEPIVSKELISKIKNEMFPAPDIWRPTSYVTVLKKQTVNAPAVVLISRISYSVEKKGCFWNRYTRWNMMIDADICMFDANQIREKYEEGL